MANAKSKKSQAVYAFPVTVYYDLEPMLIKQKYEMDKFFFEYGDDFEKELSPDKFTLLVKKYRRAVFNATGIPPDKKAEKAEKADKRIKFEEIA